MTANNWDICPACIKRAKELKDGFIKEYNGVLDEYIFQKMINEILQAIEYMKSYSSDEYKPNEEILALMKDRNIIVKYLDDIYDADDILCNGKVSACLREDYEQGVNEEGMVYIEYECQCDCGFTKKYSYKEVSN